MPLPHDGDWNINATGFTGTLTLHADASESLTASSVFGDPISGLWDETEQKLSFIRQTGGGTDPMMYQVFTGYAWSDGLGHYWLAGSFQAFQGTLATHERNVFGWQARAPVTG